MKNFCIWAGSITATVAVIAGFGYLLSHLYNLNMHEQLLEKGPALQGKVLTLTNNVYRVVRISEDGSWLQIIVDPIESQSGNTLDRRESWKIPYNHMGRRDFEKLAVNDQVALGVIGRLKELYWGEPFDHVKPISISPQPIPEPGSTVEWRGMNGLNRGTIVDFSRGE